MKDAYSFDVDDAGLERTIHENDPAPTRRSSPAASSSSRWSSPMWAPSAARRPTSSWCSPTRARTRSSSARAETTAPTSRRPRPANSRPPRRVRPKLERRTRQAPGPSGRSPVPGRFAPQTLKTLLFETDKEFVAAVVRGDLDVHEVKLKNHLGAEHLQLASEREGGAGHERSRQASRGPSGLKGRESSSTGPC